MLISADWHLTDRPEEEYRWEVFRIVARWLRDNPGQSVAVLGDLADRKDRHSARLLNRMLTEFKTLAALLVGAGKIILFPGNHDLPLLGASFWSFLGEVDGVEFFSEPGEAYPDLLVLPFVPNPEHDWAEFDLSAYRCVFMHQPVDGARDFGSTIDIHGTPMPELPKGLRVYSGDIHTPQKVGQVVYVGAPHPVKFGDRYPCRMLELDDDYRIAAVLELNPVRRHMLRVSTVEELRKADVVKGDQAKVVFEVALEEAKQWPSKRDEIYAWAAANGVQLFSVEPVVQMVARRKGGRAVLAYGASDPQEVLEAFAAEEGLGEVQVEAGRVLLEKAQERKLA